MRASTGCAGLPSRGGPSGGQSVRGTGLRAPPRSISTRTSPTPWPTTSRRPATRSSRRRWASNCSSRRRGCGVQSGTSTPPPTSSASTASPDQYPLFLHFPYFDLYRKQVVKQTDLVLAMLLRSDAFTPEQKARNFAYYEPLTVRDSSLSACVQAVLAAEVGQLQLAYDYLGEAALIDLHDLAHNVRDGVHMASLAGTWLALVVGFSGMRLQHGSLSFAPRLPEAL